MIENWESVQRLFRQALDLRCEERAQFLDAARNGLFGRSAHIQLPARKRA
jgi:hypothetical protein